ncbi:MAG: 4Fe-4S dicluster domain-containing protein [Dehalococcoidia bacterium]
MRRILIEEEVHLFGNLVKTLSGEDVSRCYQCGKCSAGCPIASEMEILPDRIIRLIQINSKDTVLGSSTIWLCASCETCFTRCPEEIDLATVMDVLRKLSMEGGYRCPEEGILRFNRFFLASVKNYGRIHDLGLIVRYNLASRRPFKNLGQGIALFRRGRIPLRPQRIRGMDQIRGIFAKSRPFREREASGGGGR